MTRPTTVAEAVAEDAAAGGRAPRALRPRIEDGHVRVLGAALPWNARATLVVTVALVLVLVSLVLSLTLGRLGIALADLPAVLRGEGSKTEHFVVFTNRLPRAVVGICAGAALGISGAIFQSVTRNPLGSPDIIGLNAGAAAGAAAVTLVWPGLLPAPVGALLGGAVAVVLVLLGAGRGVQAPLRMVVIGIGVGAMSLAFVQFAITRTRREQAQEMAAWLNGSLNARSWEHVTIIAVALVVLGLAALALSRGLQHVEMGDDAAVALGVPARRVRLLAVAVGVGLAAAAVVVCGPVAFVALVAPQVARRVTGSTGPGMVAAGATGALLLVGADLVAVHQPWFGSLPVGVLTAGIGGLYLAVLLTREWRRGTL
ncbi:MULTISPECIES: FecCD family ABC transporter permease [Sanguibacter]|uniref:Iron chelate uptake ABC transporter family permease subunit n=2 Tax=Sanguibacter TaxID=60919 RepID=A0A853ETX1_9MICO|nr:MULTISPECIES: iron chelate uptake ABC transporter family permease subunit [Sanguibacter]MBF0722806.1 iron chelate uptake ABC transporter family permease subunit [Sanguibacter inulinus]NYS93951.1 iron chelate uptake ABC transporter family permease subunit [Sanguibacter inulinus]WPF83008.1 iron chelate uptake ABC transporter family permease subunit [Sanguibacter sp. 4.1]